MANPDIPASPLLNCDVLLSVAEKLLFSPDNDFRLDLRDPNAAVTNFMFAGPACRWALFTQFRRLAKLSVNLTEIHLSCPTPIQGVCGLLANNKEFFQGPFVVSDNFFFKLFCKGVLRPKIVDSFFKFGLKGSSSTGSMTNSAGSADEKNSLRALRKDDVLTNESPAESLVRLFFFKNSPKFLDKLPNDSFAHCHLELQHVKIQDDTAIFRQLGRILNLNSQNYLLEISSEIDNCVSKFARPSITANRTRTVQLSYIIDIIDPEEAILVQLPVHKFYSLLRYVADCCPNLEKMSVNFLLQGEFSDEDFKVLSDWLVDTVEGFRTGELSMMGFTFDLNVSFRAFFPESTLVEASKKNHKLANMGESIHLEEGLDDIDLPDTFIIARRMQMRKQPLLCVTYSLIGIEDESSNNDWDGFHGAIMPVLQPMVVPVLPMAPFVLAVGSDDSD